MPAKPHDDEVTEDVWFNIYETGNGAVMIGFTSETEARSASTRGLLARVKRRITYREGDGLK